MKRTHNTNHLLEFHPAGARDPEAAREQMIDALNRRNIRWWESGGVILWRQRETVLASATRERIVARLMEQHDYLERQARQAVAWFQWLGTAAAIHDAYQAERRHKRWRPGPVRKA